MSRTMNVLMITHHRRYKALHRSGSIARHLAERGHRVSLILTSDSRRTGIVQSTWDGVRLIEMPDLLWGRLRSGWDPWDLLHRTAFLARDGDSYDLVHCFETRPATIYPALFYCQRRPVTLVTDWNDWWGRGGLIDEMRPRWYRVLFGAMETYYEEAFRTRAQGVTVISTALARRAMDLGVPHDRVYVLPGGAPLDWFRSRSKEECRQRMGLPLEDPIIGFSSLDTYFDLEIVMRSLPIVVDKRPSVKLVITGKAGRAVADLARSYGVERNVYLTGFLPDEELPWYLGCADLFVMPFSDKVYNVGRWPNKIGDYMSLGRPIITNPVGDMKALFEKHDIGLLAEWDPTDFGQKILWLLDNPGAAKTLGDNARHLAETQYDWRVLAARVEEFYYQLLDANAPRPSQPDGGPDPLPRRQVA